jgi:hypothetical protein
MTTENLVELFLNGLAHGNNFMTNVGNIYGKHMEFQYTLQEKQQSLGRPNLGRIGIMCELWPSDYSDDNVGKSPFGIRYFIKYETNIEGINPFKFEIGHETFSKLVKPFRVKERLQASLKDSQKIVDFKKRMDKLEEDYKVEVSSLQRLVITEKSAKNDINKY